MEKDSNNIRSRLAERFSQLKMASPPKGLASACEDIDIDIYEFEGYIAGLVSSYLSGLNVDPASIDQGNDIECRLDKCEKKLRDMRVYWDMVHEVAALLVECLNTKS